MLMSICGGGVQAAFENWIIIKNNWTLAVSLNFIKFDIIQLNFN
jgi:hypothetical protein